MDTLSSPQILCGEGWHGGKTSINSKETMDIKPERNLDQILAKNPELITLSKVANVTPNNDTIWKYWAKRIGVVELIMKCNSVTSAGDKVEFNEVHPLLMA